MSDRLDRVLDVLDVGLQGSREHGYGTDTAPDRCARCQAHKLTDGDLCSGCRAYLLGDTEDDPCESFPRLRWDEWTTPPRRPQQSGPRFVRGGTATFSVVDEVAWHVDPAALGATVEQINRAATDAVQALGVSFSDAAEAITRAFNASSIPGMLESLRGDIEAQATDDTATDLLVRRHGSAAYCPRHGQTKGGTCLKCARGRP